ncbi:kyphoscoliosis peptidase-like isoform X3 [Hemicordylus capensis]|uniref:kyphoscoliosis peptidase-like isoform X3 n=1 Tax=Hemicordylus capensis TaxID=884348 RepID=UPI002304C977|nr:kyphoscoliosis peptidase-like isoform X3 [Hemicordylus capensis]
MFPLYYILRNVIETKFRFGISVVFPQQGNKAFVGSSASRKKYSLYTPFFFEGNNQASRLLSKKAHICGGWCLLSPCVSRSSRHSPSSASGVSSFQNAGRLAPPPGEQDSFDYPWDKSSLKSMPIDLKQLKKLDAYASKVDVKDSIETLVNTLLQKAHGDLEKVRAIWIWICHHIEYSKAEKSYEPADVFRLRKSICAGYAALFQKMCRYKEFYFLTHPALFINNHFPDDHKWQLLNPTLTLQQFGDNMQYRTKFYSLGLLAASPGTSVFETDNGKATVFIESCSPTFFQSTLNGVNDCCLTTLQRNGMKLEVYPQKRGTHCLNIYAKASRRENYSHVLEYSLKCGSVHKRICLPTVLIQPVGPSWHSEKKGILRALPCHPIIHTDDGRCVVTFTQSKNLDFFVTLDSDTSSVLDATRRRHIWKTCRGNQVELKIHLPHAGDFALSIWAKKISDPVSYDCALSYLVSCSNTFVRWPVFPKNFTNWEDGFELVAPLVGILPSSCMAQFKLKLPGVAEASVQCGEIHPLSLSQEGFWEGACHTSGVSKVIVRVSKNDDNIFWPLLEYKVESQQMSN